MVIFGSLFPSREYSISDAEDALLIRLEEGQCLYDSSSKIPFIKGEGKRWGLSAPKPLTRAVTALDPYLWMIADDERKRKRSLRYCASGPAAESGQPGCFASGESRGIIPRGKRAFPLGFSRLSWARSPLSFVTPASQAKVVYSSQPTDFA